jgi:hypothetical protein
VIAGNDPECFFARGLSLTADYADSEKSGSETRPTTVVVSSAKKFCRGMSRFPARCCVMEYEIILFSQNETAASAGGNLPDCSGISRLNFCANHYHL